MDIQALISKKFGRFRRSKGQHGLEYIVTCPFCRRKEKMYINPSQDVFICFRCGEKGSAQDLLGHSWNMNGGAAALTPLPSNVQSPGQLVPLTELEDSHPACVYIRKRKFDIRELSDVYGVRYCTSGQLFGGIFNTTNTLVFPFWMKEQLIGWQARLMYDPDKLVDTDCEALGLPRDEDGDWVKPPKYWTSPGLPKGRVLYNYDWASRGEIVVVCEGVFDAMGVGRSAVATLGKGVTEDQANLLHINRTWKLVVIMLDPGDATNEMRKLEHQLTGVPSIVVELQGYKDPGEAPREEIWIQIARAARKQNIDILQYRFNL
jgi:hypothetical protein